MTQNDIKFGNGGNNTIQLIIKCVLKLEMHERRCRYLCCSMLNNHACESYHHAQFSFSTCVSPTASTQTQQRRSASLIAFRIIDDETILPACLRLVCPIQHAREIIVGTSSGSSAWGADAAQVHMLHVNVLGPAYQSCKCVRINEQCI